MTNKVAFERSLAALYPEIAKEWHPELNGDKTPKGIVPGSNTKVWWLGKDCGHEWESKVGNRTSKTGKCPYCTSRRLLPGFNDLATKFPDIAAQWHPTKNGDTKPTDVFSSSNTKVWWLGKCGHEWHASPNGRTNSKSPRGCKYCSGNATLAGFNDLATTHPQTAKEWHPTKNKVAATEVQYASNPKVWWLGECGHEWDMSPNSRTIHNQNCPYCAGKRVLAGFNDLATTHPELATLWHPTKNPKHSPETVSYGSHTKVHWLGECGHEWSGTVKETVITKTKCPYCSRSRLLTGFNDLATLHPDIAAEWHPTKNGKLTPTDIMPQHKTKVWWLGKDCGHEWETKPVYRVWDQTGCPYCGLGRKVLTGSTDLATTHPTLAAEWHPTLNGELLPSGVVAGSAKKVWWLGKDCGHEWEAALSKRSLGSGCHYCTRQLPLVGFSDLTTTHPELAEEWDFEKNEGIDIATVMAGTSAMMWWKCQKGHSWRVSPNGRTSGNHGCPQCCVSSLISKMEVEVHDSIVALLGSAEGVLQSDRSVLKGELDIHILDKNVAVEFNGVYWHSEEWGKDRNYHARKSEAAAEKGIHLVHVWEDDWRDRRDIVVRALAHRLNATERLNEPGVLLVPDESLTRRYGARTLSTEVLTHAESAAFLEANHIQGSSTGTVHTGLRDKEGILRAVFVAKRVGNAGHEGSWRIERYATRGIVPGGFTKLMKFTEKQITELDLGAITKWVTFSDRALSDGGLYRNYGFTEDGFVQPDYRYVVGGRRVHKFNYRLSRFRSDAGLQYQEGLSERELALLNGIHRIWDSGKTRWVREVSAGSLPI